MRNQAESLFQLRQDEICAALSALDGQPFREDNWTRDEGGGGRTRVLQSGGFFEKAGVNFSSVHGAMPKEIAESAKGRGIDIGSDRAEFFATGISLVLHPINPHAPTVHANYRFFEVQREGLEPLWWFGGGTDITPNYLVEDDIVHFHRTLKEACDRHDPRYYPDFKDWCDRYFFIAHRAESRGLGGIFFDNLNDRGQDELFEFVSDCSGVFLDGVMPIYEARRHDAYDAEQTHWQRLRRGRYVEFNLVYDRGTSFGLRTKGRTESILMSLPLEARWEYDQRPEEGSPEHELWTALREPRAWA